MNFLSSMEQIGIDSPFHVCLYLISDRASCNKSELCCAIVARHRMAQMNSKVDINPKLSPQLLSEPSPDLDAELNPELNINSRLPPELLTSIFHFLPISDLNNALLVCRLAG